MKKIILTICFCLITSLSFSAELLVQMEDSKFEKGAKKGDIIIVKPDGWVWGKEESPPRYVVFKLPEMTYEEAKKYEEATDDLDAIGFKLRKYSVDTLEVDDAKMKVKGVKTIDKTKVIEFKEQKIKDRDK